MARGNPLPPSLPPSLSALPSLPPFHPISSHWSLSPSFHSKHLLRGGLLRFNRRVFDFNGRRPAPFPFPLSPFPLPLLPPPDAVDYEVNFCVTVSHLREEAHVCVCVSVCGAVRSGAATPQNQSLTDSALSLMNDIINSPTTTTTTNSNQT